MQLRATTLIEYTLVHERDGCMMQVWIRSRILHTRWMHQMGAVLRPWFAVTGQSIECKLLWMRLVSLLRLLGTLQGGRCRRYRSSFAFMLRNAPVPSKEVSTGEGRSTRTFVRLVSCIYTAQSVSVELSNAHTQALWRNSTPYFKPRMAP